MTTRELYQSKHGRNPFTILKGGANRGKGKNTPMLWGDFCLMLSKPLVSDEKMINYINGTQDERNDIKAKAGWYIACATEKGKRSASTLYPRHIITIDVDEPSPELWAAVKAGTLAPLNEFEYFAHITKSATGKKPKFRIIILSSRPILPEDFRALCTIVCWMLIDKTLNSIDDVCFRPAQIMYLPVVSVDQSYQFVHNPGKLCDPYHLAELWGKEQFEDIDAWKDYEKVPSSERQGKRRLAAAKAERPREKDGVVGAFCRAFNVIDAIEEFDLPYAPTDGSHDDSRYTYTKGSGSGGAVIYDDGDFLYSNHQSDPCGEQGVNAFDLVRRHKFLDLDADVRADTSPGKLPSFKAMATLATGYPAVRGELLASRIDSVAMLSDEDVEGGDFEEPSELASPNGITAVEHAEQTTVLPEVVLDEDALALLGWGPPKPPKDWLQTLDVTDNGTIKPTTANIATILRYDSRTFGRIGFNEMSERKMIRKAIRTKCAILPIIKVRDRVDGDHFEDRHRVALKLIIESAAGKGQAGYGIKVPDNMMVDAVDIAAHGNSFNPVKDFFSRHNWDGVERLDTLFIRYLGLEDTAYHREVSRLTILAIVTRVFEPGHKFDNAPILQGVGGSRKSTFVKTLGMRVWFSELTADFGDTKACVEQMRSGAIVMELPELTSLSRADVNTAKGFITRENDEVRLAYGRESTLWRRRNVFIGTTNNTEYLRDDKGNRRFWPLKVNKTEEDPIDTDALLAEMPQVYAEAKQIYQEMRSSQPIGILPLVLSHGSALEEARLAQEGARTIGAEDDLAGSIEHWLDTPVRRSVVEPGCSEAESQEMVVRTRVSASLVWTDLMGGDEHRIPGRDATMIGIALNRVEALSEGATVRYPGVKQQRWRWRAGERGQDVERGWKPYEGETPPTTPEPDPFEEDLI